MGQFAVVTTWLAHQEVSAIGRMSGSRQTTAAFSGRKERAFLELVPGRKTRDTETNGNYRQFSMAYLLSYKSANKNLDAQHQRYNVMPF
jgi:hypothetical protein